MSRSWERDELILALDLYFRVGAMVPSDNPAVVEVSNLLRALPLSQRALSSPTFRSPDSVHLKLQNFLSIDPAQRGKGMAHASQADRQVWKEFAESRMFVSRLASELRQSVKSPEIGGGIEEEDEEDFPEGRILYRVHRRHEQSRALAAKLKTRWLNNHGKLSCVPCGFDFERVYGVRGKGYIECHHIVPVSELRPGARTRVEDLVPVCSNCHKMLHRRRPWLSLSQLRGLISVQP
jgi:5-methylcytosine-specific restriction protein A